MKSACDPKQTLGSICTQISWESDMKQLIATGILAFSFVANAADSPFLYIWAADEDGEDSDFVAVVDANPDSRTYGDVLATIEVGLSTGAHHTEHRMPEDGLLFMNGFRSGHSFVVDLSEPLAPIVASHFTTVGDLSHAHSFERLPSGNVLATFQNGPDGERITGGVVEFAPSGEPIRWTSAAVSGEPDIRPYSLAIIPRANMALTTTADMWGEVRAHSVQLWRLSDLSLTHTLQFPPGLRVDEHEWPLEPRLMADGDTLIVNTSGCGLYQVSRLQSDSPQVNHIYSFAAGEGNGCSLPVTAAHYWVQTVDARNGLVSLDLSDPAHPKEVGYVGLGSSFTPHWIAIEQNDRRIVVTGFGDMRNSVAMLELDTSDGSLTIDQDFGVDGVINFAREKWPHGDTGSAVPHGSIFSIP
jgi:hypothetical protein